MKVEKVAPTFAATLMVVVAGGLAWAVLGDAPQGPITRCEETAIGFLLAPSTYERIAVSGPHRREATADEARGVTGWIREALLDTNAAASGGDRTYHADKLAVAYYLVEYDAANAYGTPIRDYYTCEQLVYGDQPFDAGGPVPVRVGTAP